MNNINLIGRLTADPELRYTPNSVEVCKFTIAVQRPHVKDTTDFIRCVAWRKTAEFIDMYFSKGKMIAITGILTTRSWKDKEGKNVTINEVLVDSVDFCGDKTENKKPKTNDDVPKDFEEIQEEIPF